MIRQVARGKPNIAATDRMPGLAGRIRRAGRLAVWTIGQLAS